MKKAIVVMTPEAVRELFCLPKGATFAEMRVPFNSPGTLEVKVHGAGWETPEGAIIQRTDPATVTRNKDGSFDIDWKLPA